MPETRAASAAHDSSRTVAAGLLAWVWPGLGHLYLGRRGKGLVLMGSILALFVLGVSMDSRLQLHLGLEDPLALLFSLAQMGVGAPYVIARRPSRSTPAERPVKGGEGDGDYFLNLRRTKCAAQRAL